jgi:hypothetical protein
VFKADSQLSFCAPILVGVQNLNQCILLGSNVEMPWRVIYLRTKKSAPDRFEALP